MSKPPAVWVIEGSFSWDRQWMPRAAHYETRTEARGAAMVLRRQYRDAKYRVAKYVRTGHPR